MPPIYLDHCSTTPIDPIVLDTMLPFLRESFGNPGTPHPSVGGAVHLDLAHVPPRGRWGTPTARAFTTAIKRAVERAIVERDRAKRGEG